MTDKNARREYFSITFRIEDPEVFRTFLKPHIDSMARNYPLNGAVPVAAEWGNIFEERDSLGAQVESGND